MLSGARPVQVGQRIARQLQGVRIVFGVVVGDAGLAAVHVRAAEGFGIDDLAGGGLHQRRAAEENGALLAHDDGFVAHGRHIGAAGRARTHDHGDLRNIGGRQARLVVEDAAKMVAVREHLVLQRQKGAAGIDQVHAGQVVFSGNFLGAQVLFYGHRGSRCRL